MCVRRAPKTLDNQKKKTKIYWTKIYNSLFHAWTTNSLNEKKFHQKPTHKILIFLVPNNNQICMRWMMNVVKTYKYRKYDDERRVPFFLRPHQITSHKHYKNDNHSGLVPPRNSACMISVQVHTNKIMLDVIYACEIFCVLYTALRVLYIF